MQPTAAAPSPRKRKQPAGGFGEEQPRAERGLPKPDSQMNLLLSAIDACERVVPGAHLAGGLCPAVMLCRLPAC